MSKGYKEMEEEIRAFEKVDMQIRQAHRDMFGLDGAYDTDEQILKWFNETHREDSVPKNEETEDIGYISKTDRPKVSHYQKGSIEPIDFINTNGLNLNLGNAIKYISRCNHKGSKVEDLKKAIDYINFELEE